MYTATLLEKLEQVTTARVEVTRRDKIVFEPTIASLLERENMDFSTPAGEEFLSSCIQKVLGNNNTIRVSAYAIILDRTISFGSYLDNAQLDLEDFAEDPHTVSKKILQSYRGPVI